MHSTGATSGETRRKHAGDIAVVFTNASPETMCELRMSPDGDRGHGDNWLPSGGLPSGKSAEFKIRPGTYKAMWSTCKPPGDKPHYYAATLWRERALAVKEPTQLFAFVAGTVAPTRRAAPRQFFKLVRFPGQPIGDFPPSASQTAATQPAAAEPPEPPPSAAPPPRPTGEKFDAREWIDNKAVAKRTQDTKQTKQTKKATKPALKPSLRRTHNIADAKVNYGAKQ